MTPGLDFTEEITGEAKSCVWVHVTERGMVRRVSTR